MIIGKTFSFDAAHKLEWHNGKCKDLHGHTYKFEVLIKGEVNRAGIVIDFGDLKEIVKDEVLEFLDHKYLNDIIENPTAEEIVVWIWGKLKEKLEGLYEIKLWETESSFAVYRGE
tara:strand:- start:600 stop:944 length:345 start_codon:yes stop_codon:yes gene_type:complete